MSGITSQSLSPFNIVGVFGHTARITSQHWNNSSILWINPRQLILNIGDCPIIHMPAYIILINKYGQFDDLFWARNPTLFRGRCNHYKPIHTRYCIVWQSDLIWIRTEQGSNNKRPEKGSNTKDKTILVSRDKNNLPHSTNHRSTFWIIITSSPRQIKGQTSRNTDFNSSSTTFS